MRLDGLKIAVTGGMGYVGSQTCKVLIDAGAYVVSVDYRHVEQNIVEGVEYISADYGDEEVWHMFNQPDIIKEFGTLDGIVHCAGTSLVNPSIDAPSEYYNNNVLNTIKMLDSLKEYETKPFIVFSSSAAVYGNPTDTSKKETSIINPSTPYGKSKMMVEHILADYDKAYGIKSYIFRYFNAAGADVWDNELGPEENDTHIIPKIFEAYQNKTVFELYGADYHTTDRTCIRDYIHVCDIALAHLDACVKLSSGAVSATYNLGTNHGHSNQSIINVFREIVGDIDVLIKSRRNGDPAALVSDAKMYYNTIQYNRNLAT